MADTSAWADRRAIGHVETVRFAVADIRCADDQGAVSITWVSAWARVAPE
jgi:hypothetical protein